MQYDLLRFASVLILSLFIGLLLGYPALCVIAGLIFFTFSQYKELRQLYAWLQRRQDSDSPNQPGIIDDICREIDYTKNRHRVRETKLTGYLKRFQQATGALPDAVVVLGPNGEIEWANKNAQGYLGIRWPQDSELRIANLVRTPALNRYLSSSPDEDSKGLQMISPTSKEMTLEIRVTAYGETQQLLVARDITNIVRTNQMRKDFIANASHELRTPLTVISGYLESFADDSLCPMEWLSHIRQMRKQTNRMQNLIEDLLKLSSLEARTINEDKELVRVPDMLNTIMAEANSLSGALNHQLELVVDDELYVYGSHYQLYSAFSNLVFNAVQYTPAEGKIQVTWYQDKSGAHLLVSDDGLGIAAEHLPRLTERFYRIDKSRSRERGGTGLGLAIVKHVLANHDGQLVIDSKVGEGSIFQCDLPAKIIVSGLLENKTASG